jgi:hypothetical protein
LIHKVAARDLRDCPGKPFALRPPSAATDPSSSAEIAQPPCAAPGDDTREICRHLGYSEIDALAADGVLT